MSTILQARNYQELVLVRKERVDLPHFATGLSSHSQCFPSKYSMVQSYYWSIGLLVH